MEKHIMSSQEGFGPEFKPRSFLLSGNRVNHVVVKLFAVFFSQDLCCYHMFFMNLSPFSTAVIASMMVD